MSKVYRLPDSVKIVFLIRTTDQRFISSFLQDQLEVGFRYSVRASDSLYHTVNSDPQSEIILYQGNHVIYKSRLKDFNGRDRILLSKIKQVDIIPDSVFGSNHAMLTSQDDKIVLQDHIFNTISVFNMYSGQVLKFVKLKTVDPENFYPKLHVDSLSLNIYKQCKSTLRHYGTQNTRFGGLNVGCSRKYLFFNIVIPVPRFNNEALTIDQELLLQIIPFKSDSGMTINLDTLTEMVPGSLKLSYNGGPFIHNDDTLIYLFTSKEIESGLILVRFSCANGVIEFIDTSQISFPGYYRQKTQKTIEQISWVYNNPLLTTRRSNEVYNLTSKKQHVFPFDFDKITGKVDLLSMSLRNILVDLFLSEDKIYFISMAKNGNVFCYYLNEFDRETFKLIRCREFYFPSAYQIRQMVFKNASSLLGINNDHELVEISIPDFLDH